MNKKSILVGAAVCLFCFVLIKVLLAVPYNGRLNISPTGTHCVNEISEVVGSWMPVSEKWVAQSAEIRYQNTDISDDKGSMVASGSAGTVSISLGNKAGRYNLFLEVIYSCGTKSITAKEPATITFVDVKSISSSGNTICKSKFLYFKAEPTPTNSAFPSGHPEWEIGKKNLIGEFGDWQSKGTGDPILVTFDNSGIYKLRARCSASGTWVESEEVNVPSDGKITATPNPICGGHNGKIKLNAILDDQTAPPESPFPKWEINEVSANEADFVSLNQDGLLSFETTLSGKATGDIQIRAKFCETLSWQTITIKSVSVDDVVLNKKSVGLNETFTLKAIPTSGEFFPDDELIWEYNYKPELVGNFEGWKDFKHAGEQSFEEKLGKSGVYKFHAKCCETGKWVESKEFYVVEIKELQIKLCDNWVKANEDILNSLGKDSLAEMKALPQPNINESILPSGWVTWSGIHEAINIGNITLTAKNGKIKAKCSDSEIELELNVIENKETTIDFKVDKKTVSSGDSSFFLPPNSLLEFLEFDASLDVKNKKWHLILKTFKPKAKIEILVDGYIEPTNPFPNTEAEVQNAINDLLDYWALGKSQNYHTEAASDAHEENHHSDWKSWITYYWKNVETCLEKISVDACIYKTKQEALVELSKLAKPTVKTYSDLIWNDINPQMVRNDRTRSSPSTTGRGYKAGQIELNKTIQQLLEYGKSKNWNVNASQCIYDSCGILSFTISDPLTFYTFPAFNCQN